MSQKFQLDRFTLAPVRVCGKGYSKTDRQTHGLSKTTFLDVLKVVHPISGLISNSFFLHEANTSIEIEVKSITKMDQF